MTDEAQVAALAKIVLDAALDGNTRFVTTWKDDRWDTTVATIDATPIARAILAAGYARRDDVLEEAAATAARSRIRPMEPRTGWDIGWNCATEEIETNIRAMKAAK